MTKRIQVKNACVNCQKACKKCDERRPCERCVTYGVESTCRDSARKERRRTTKGGNSSKSGEHESSDYSDDFSSVGVSEDFRKDAIGLIKLKSRVDARKHQDTRIFLSHNGSSFRSTIRQRPICLGEERRLPHPSSGSVCAPDSSFIRTLGMICTDMLRRLEEEDLPPAVVYREWPPKVDIHFEQVMFEPDEYGVLNESLRRGLSLKHPLPIQRLPIPELLSSNGCATWSILTPPSSSSPIDLDADMKINCGTMTPPETPVNLAFAA